MKRLKMRKIVIKIFKKRRKNLNKKVAKKLLKRHKILLNDKKTQKIGKDA